MMVALSSALASSVGPLSSTGRTRAAGGVVTSSLAVIVPAALAFFAISLFWT